VKRLFVRAGSLLLGILFGAGLTPRGWAQSSGLVISNYSLLKSAVDHGGASTFGSNVTVSLSGSAEILEVSTQVVLDATTNAANINRTGGFGPIFYIHTNGSLTLLNLNISGGLSTSGGAIYNAGTLIISNCVFTANSATNAAGAAGANAVSGGNDYGGNGGNGLSASGGAIYSSGVLLVSQSIFSNNTVNAGSGGSGGNGVAAFVFGGNGGNGGNGGAAEGGAIVCTGRTNLFFATEFFANTCTAGVGGAGGAAASGQFSGQNGSGGVGGSASGGAVVASGSLFMTNCLFSGNSVSGGGTSGDGQSGGSASGGGLDLVNSAKPAWIENTTFFQNSCVGGPGGGSSSTTANASAGNGGAVAGGGLASSAALLRLLNCTLATNTLTPGAAGVGTGGANNGSIGAIEGAQLARLAGALEMGSSILSGGTNATLTNLNSQTYVTNTQPNCFGGLTDLGFNISSDTSVAFTETTSTNSEDPVLDTVLSTPGNTAVGLLGGATLSTLAVLPGSPAIGTDGVIPGVPGLSFPATDQALQPRGTPTCIGAYEADPLSSTNGWGVPVLYQPPADQTVGVGGMAVFEVGATNSLIIAITTNTTITLTTNVSGTTTNITSVTNTTITTNLGPNDASIGYQWQLNGTNLSDGPHVSGAWSNILTLTKIALANQGSYSVIVGNSTLIGVTNSAPAILSVIAPPRFLVQPPKTLKALVGSTATISATPSGSIPLTFQWLCDGTNLDDGNGISGATNSLLTIDPVLETDAGSYSLIVANAYGSANSAATKLTVLPDTVPPKVSITLPAANARTTVPTLEGTASDNAQVTKVSYWLTNINHGFSATNGVATLTAGRGAISNWSIQVVPLPGTNILTVKSVDFSGNGSKPDSRTFFYEVPAALRVQTVGTGSGAFTGKAAAPGGSLPANGALLNLGESYSITAIPGKTSLFSNWVASSNWVAGFVVSNNPTLKFIMSTNLTLQANFSSNIFLAGAGTYNGLFYPTNSANAVAEETSGMLYNLLLKKTGAFTATLLTGSKKYPVSANFDVSGQSFFKAGQLKVDLTLDITNRQITGTVSNTQWSANLIADFASSSLPSAQYTLLFSPSGQVSPISPPGDGYALVKDHLGTVTLTGALADGASYSQTVSASGTGDIPVYASLYANTGLLLGWINLTNLEAPSPANQLTWIKKPSRAPALYPNGFTNILTLQGSPWTNPPAKEPAISLTNGDLLISNASPELVFTFTNVTVNNNNVLLGGNPARTFAGSINPRSGLLTLTFETTNKSSAKAYGAVLQNQAAAGGYFLTTTNAGSVLLQSP